MPILASGERQIDQVVAFCAGLGQGTLFLTDRRLIFEYSQGLVNRQQLQLGITLNQIQSVSAKHGHFGVQEIMIATKDANNGFHSNMVTIRISMHPEIWVTKINNMLVPTTSYHYSSQPTTTVVEREVVKIPCKYCGNLNDIARNNTCSSCGAPLYKG